MKASSWRGATTPAHRQATLKLSLARHSEQKPRMKKNFCRIWEGRKCRIQKKIGPLNRSEKSSFKPVESDQFQIGPRRCLDIIARANKKPGRISPQRTICGCVSSIQKKLPCLTHMKPNREKIETEELVKERLPLTKWELTPKEKEDFNRVMRLIFDAASIVRHDLELGEDAIGKTLIELADWATN